MLNAANTSHSLYLLVSVNGSRVQPGFAGRGGRWFVVSTAATRHIPTLGALQLSEKFWHL